MSIRNAATIAAPCYLCCAADMAASGPTDGLCWGCRKKVAANRVAQRGELIRHLATGHGIGHHGYRAEVRFGAL